MKGERREREKRKRKGIAGGRPESEEMEVSSKEEHVPDHLPHRKDETLFAPIVPHSAETSNLCGRSRMS
jgi:hypothetical protein